MGTFNDLATNYRGLAEGYPDTIIDDFEGAYTADIGASDAKIQQLTIENATLLQDLNTQKAANYDLLMQIAVPEAPAETGSEDAGDGEDEGDETPDDLFTED